MRMLTAKVVDGRLDVPEGLLEEGETVTILATESEEALELTREEQALLEESMAQIRRGEWVDGWDLLEQLEVT